MVRGESLPAIACRICLGRQPYQMFDRRESALDPAPATPAKDTVNSLDGQERRRLGPKIFQTVEIPLIFREDVNQYVPEVKYDPTARRRALDSLGTNTGFRHSLGDSAINGAKLTLVSAGRNHEVISKRREFVDVEHDSIAGRCVADDVRQQQRSLSPGFRGGRPFGCPDIIEFWRHPMLLDRPQYRRVMVGPAGIEPATLGL
jgi:hypothetical protein